MSTSSPADIADLEEKYNEIHKQRLELEAELFRIKKECEILKQEIMNTQNQGQIQTIHKKISAI